MKLWRLTRRRFVISRFYNRELHCDRGPRFLTLYRDSPIGLLDKAINLTETKSCSVGPFCSEERVENPR